VPHVVLEYSANLSETSADVAMLLERIHIVLGTLGFAVDDVKSRAYRCETYRVGTGADDRAFAHLTIGVLDRNPPERRRAIAEAVLGVMGDALARSRKALDCDVTVEVRAMDGDGYRKLRAS
jgi:5-carboxymethyl-2-hydroxymuconate isomerase